MLRSFAVVGLNQGLVGALGQQAAVLPVGSEGVRGAGTASVWKRFRLGLVRTLVLAVLALGASGAWASTTINQQYTPATMNPGDTSRFKITVLNASLVALTEAKVTVVLNSAVTIAATPNISNGCGFTVAQGSSGGGSTLELTSGGIPAGTGTADGQCFFEVDVTATSPGNWASNIPANTTPNATTAGYTAKENGVDVSNTTEANATLSINTLQAPTGSKVFATSPVIAGDPTTLTITLANPNTAATMPLTTFTDTLPTGMVVAATPNASTTCGGTVTAVASTNTVTLTGGTIPVSSSCTVSADVVVATITGLTQDFVNTLADGAIGNTRGLTSPGFTKTLRVNTPIGVSKTIVPALIAAGEPALMTISIKNNSTANSLDITSVNDNLTGTTLKILTTTSSPVAATAAPAVTCSGTGAINGTLTATADTLDQTLNLANAKAGPGGTCTITAYVTSSVDGLHTNNIAADAVTNTAGHHSPAASDTLTASAQLTIAKTVSVNNVAPGQYTVFSVAINNWSGGQVTNVSFKDVLPKNGVNQMVLDNTNGAIYTTDAGCNVAGTWTGTNDAGTSTGNAPAVGDAGIAWTGGGIVAGSGVNPGVCNITIRAKLPAGAASGLNFNNSIPIGGITGTGPSGAVANTNLSSANVASVDSGAVVKAFAPSTIAQGGTSTLTVTIYNRTASALTSVGLTDNLPAGLTLAANPAAVNNCGGTLQAFPGGNQLILAGATVAARPVASKESSCTFSAKVTGSAVGSYTNTIATNALTNAENVGNTQASATLVINTGIGAAKTFTPLAVASGGTARVKLTITNSSSGQLTNVSVDDNNFGSGLTVANPANAATNCAGSTTLVVNPGQTRAQLQGATLAAGASCDFSFDVQTSGAGPWSNTVPVGNITSAEGVFNSAAVTANLTVATAAITLNKSFNPVAVTGGVPSTLQIDVTGINGIAISGTGFTDTFPPGIVVYSVPNASTNCAGGVVTAVPGDNKVSLSGATLAATGVACHVYVQTTSERFLNLTNTIPAGAVSSDQGYTNTLATTASLSTLQGLGVMKSFEPAYIVPNAVSKLKLRLVSTFDSNAYSPITLTNVSFTDSLPAGMTVAATPDAGTDCPSGVVTTTSGASLITISGATITPGTSCNIWVNVTASTLGAYTNTIPVNAITTTQGIPNQSPASDILYVVAKPTVSKAFSPTSVNMGESSTLTVTINNNYSGAVALSGVSLTDSLPLGLYIASTPAASTTCSNGVVTADAGTNVLALSGASIAAGASCTFQAKVVSNTAASYTNNIPDSALVNAQGLTNPGPATGPLTVLPPASVSKVFSPASISAGGTSTLTITLGNAGSSEITLTSALVDALPGNVFVHSIPNVSKNCLGAVTAVAGATSITYANGATIPAGGCTIAVDVTSSVAGGYTNTIAAGQLTTDAGNNPSPAVATLGVDKPAAPTVSKSFSPGTIAAGGTSTLTINLGNPNTDAAALTATFTDTLPANVLVASAPAIGGSCTTASVTAAASGSTITYASGAEIPAGGCTITVAVTSAVSGSYTNTIAAGALVTAGGGNPQPATAPLVVVSPIPPTIAKSFNPNVINPGGISRLMITLGNSNATAITLSSDLNDTLPTGVTVASTPNIGGTCVNASGTPNAVSAVIAAAGSNTITFANSATIPSGFCTILVDVTASNNTLSPFTNTIAVNALDTTAGKNSAAATDKLFVNPPQPPSVSKSFSNALLPKGATSTLTLSLSNGNASALTLSADFVDTLPGSVVVANPNGLLTTSGCVAGNVVAVAGESTITYKSGATLPGNSGCTIVVNVTSPTATALLTNTIAAGALKTDEAGSNTVAATAPIQFVEWPTNTDLAITKAIAPGTGVAGSTQTVTLTWKNASTATPVQNMYQCVVSDPLPAAFDGSTATEGTTPTGYTYSRSGNTVTYTRTNTSTPCETALQTATFAVNLISSVVTGSTYTNTATLTAKTLPSNETGAGTLTKDASANVVVSGPVASAKTVTATSQGFTLDTDLNGNPPAAIGETVTYSIPFNLQPGVTKSVTLVDEIITGIGDVSLVSATLQKSSTGLSAVSDPASINAAAISTPVTVSLTSGGALPANEFQLALGDVTNTDSAAATYTLTITLRVANVATNTAGHAITDQGRIRYKNVANTDLTVVTTATKSVHVALPVVQITKTASPAAPAGGDTVIYTLTIKNNSTGVNAAMGYDWTFTDTLPAELTNPGSFTVTGNAGTHAVTGTFTSNTLNGTIDVLAPGESVVATYTATVVTGTAYGKAIANSATATATTIPSTSTDDAAGRRTGDATGANNLRATTSATVTTGKPTMTKAVVDAQSYYAIGDLVHYRITVAVPVGTTSAFTITDALPAGLVYYGATTPTLSVTGGVTAPTAGTITPTVTTPSGMTTHNFSLGNITATSAGSVVIDFYAQVTNVHTNQNNTSISNVANASYTNPSGGAALTLTASAAAIKVGEPNLTMTKTIVSGATGSDADSTVRWQLTVANANTVAAYQQTIIDQLPDHLNNISNISVTPTGSVYPNVAGCGTGTAVGTGNAAVTTTTNANDTLTIAGICMAPGATLTVQYDTKVMNTAVAAEVLTNTVRSSYASQATGTSGSAVVRDGADASTDDDTDPTATCDGSTSTKKCNNYNESASGALTISAAIAIDKQADKTQATIGETMTYTLKVSVIEGVIPSVVVSDILPAGLTYVSHTISLGNVGMSLGNASYAMREGADQTVQFTLGNVVNNADADATNDFVTLAITARVDNIAANQKGTILKNGEGTGTGQTTPTVTVKYGSTPVTVGYDHETSSPTSYQGRPLTIIEPALKLTKTAVPVAQSLGDEVFFTLLIEHNGSSSDANAFDLQVTDTLPTGLTYVSGSASTAPSSVAGQVLTFPVIASLTQAQTTTITYRAKVDSAAVVGTALLNTAAVTWKGLTGATGAADNGRTGPLDSGDTLNDYKASNQASVTPTTSAFISAQKTVAIHVDQNSDGIANPGETLRYTVTLVNTSSTTAATNVVFSDAIPANTAYVTSSVTLGGSAATNSGSSTQLSVNVGNMAANATVTITFDVTINAGTPAGILISNQGQVDSDQTVPKPTDEDGNPANGDQPTTIPVGGSGAGALYASKYVGLLTDTAPLGTTSAGDTMRYNLFVRNSGGTALADVVLTDPIPAGLTATGTPNAAQGSISVTSGVVTWNIGALPVGQIVNAYFDVTIDAFSGSKTFSNQGNVSSTTSGVITVPTDGNGDPGDGAQPTVFDAGISAPRLDVQKRWSLDGDADNNGFPSKGDSLRYAVSVTNSGDITATNVRLSDPAPTCTPSASPCTSLIGGSVAASPGVVLAEGPPLSVNIGSLAPGQTATVSWRVTAAAENGNVIANQASVTAANVTGGPTLSDNDGVPGNGINPTLTPLDDGTTGLAAPSNLAKALYATNQAGSTGSSVLIGEIATWRVSINVPPGNTRSLTLTDTLPAHLALVAGSGKLLYTSGSALSASANPGGINSAISGSQVALGGALVTTANGDGTTTLALALGNINNSATTTGSSYTLEFQSQVSNVAANVSTQTRTNSATASFLNSLGQPLTLTPVTASVTIVEPVLTVTLTNSPAALLPVGGPVAFTSVLTNTSTVPASDVTLNIPLPTGFTAAASVVVNSSDGTSSCATGVGTPTTTGAPPVVGVTIGSMPAGCVVTVTFTGTAGNTLTSGSSLSTIATTRWTSLPGDVTGERTGSGTAPDNYVGAATAGILVNDLSLTKALTTTAARYAIGDTVGYKLTLSIPGPFGPISNVQLSDILPVGLVYTGSSSVANTSGATSLTPAALSGTGVTGDPLILNLGTVNNTSSTAHEVVVNFGARVTNVLANQDNTSWPNFGTLAFTDPATLALTTRNTAEVSVTLGEPNLNPTLAAVTATTNLSAGNTVTYEYVATNNGTTVMHDLVLSNTLPSALTNVQGLTVMSVNDAAPTGDATPAVSMTLSGTGTNAWTSSPFTLGVGDSVTIRYTVTLANTVQPGVAIQNAVIGTFTSRAGVDANERSGSTTGPIETDTTGSVDNYRADAVSPAFTSDDPVSFTKAFLPSSTTQYAVGATVSYRLTVGMPQGTVNNLVVTDTLPAGLDLVSAKVASFGNGAMTFTGSTTTPTSAVTGTGTTLVTWTLGDVVNPADAASNNDVITFDIDARVANTQANQAAVTLGNNATMSFVDGASVTQTRNFDADASTAGLQPLNLTIIEPVLALVKSANVTSMSLGDQVRFSLLVDHLPSSGADANDVSVVDVLAVGLTYVAGTGSVTPTISVLGDGRQQLVFNVGTLTKTDDHTTIAYSAQVSAAAAVGTPLTNSATLTWGSQSAATGAASSGRTGSDGLLDTSGILNDYQAQSSTSISPNANAIYTTKTVALVVDATRPDVVDVGDTLQYTVVLHNGSTAVTNVVFTDTLPANTSYVANSLTLGGIAASNVGSNAALAVNVGAMAANAAATITFRVTVDTATPPNTMISNQGSVDSDQTVPRLTDADSTPDNGDQPTNIPVGPAMPVPGVQVQKTSYLGHSAGVGCASGQNPLVVVDANHAPKNITWCFAVTNTGSSYLTSPLFTDAGLGITSADQSRVRLATGVLPLAPGTSATWYVEEERTTSLVNTVTASLTPTDATGRGIGLPNISGTTGSAAVFAYVFDPPFGIKTGVLNGQTVVRWNMVWINDNLVTASDVVITDPPPLGMTYAGNLVCTPQGSTVVKTCSFEAASAAFPRGRVRVVTDLGPDLGATDAATANNELQIAFDATIDNPLVQQTFQNQGTAEWNPDNGTPFTAVTRAPTTQGGPTVVTYAPAVTGVPTLSEWGLIMLSGLVLLLGLARSRRQRGAMR